MDKIILNESRNVILIPFIKDEKVRPTILICPGGAYTECSAEGEAALARMYNDLGFNCFSLGYSVAKNFKWPYPLDDFESAMEYIINNKDKYNVDINHIIALGLSAGAHLVSVAASIAKHKPYAAILAYPVTMKKDIEYTAPGLIDSVSLVNLDTCPCFILASRNDWIAPVKNALEYANALEKNFVDFELQILGYSMHGYDFNGGGRANPQLYCSRVEDRVKNSASWIDELISGKYVSVRKNCPYIDATAKYLSIKNSCGTILANKEAKKMIEEKFPFVLGIYNQVKQLVNGFIDTVSIEFAMSYAKILTGIDVDLNKLNDELVVIENI